MERIINTILTINIDTINESFQDGNANIELINILKKLINKIEGQDYIDSSIRDTNGNKVGEMYLSINEDDF